MKRWFVVFLCLLLLHSAEANAREVVVLGRELEPKQLTFRALKLDALEVVDAAGRAERLSLDQVVRASFVTALAGQDQPAPGMAVAKLTDGQVLIGRLIGPGEDGESVRLQLSIGNREIDVPLDSLLALKLQPGNRPTPTTDDDDVLLLATGETLTGFVEGVGVGFVDFIVGDADDPIQIPLERIHGFAIANKPEPIQPKDGQQLVCIRLRDGSSFILRDVESTAATSSTPARLTGESVLPLDVKAITLAMDDVVKIEPLSKAFTLTPLSSIAFELIDGGEVFGVPMPPRLTPVGALRIHAPVTLGFDLPDGAGRLAMTASLDLDDTISPARRALAGCELVVYNGDKPVAKYLLKPGDPPQRIIVPLHAADLRLQLNPDVNGPVLDRVLITDAELLILRP